MILQQTVFYLSLGLGLFVPGWLLTQALRTRACILSSFLGSAAIMINVVIAIDALGASLNRTNLFGTLAVISLSLWLTAKPTSNRRPCFRGWRARPEAMVCQPVRTWAPLFNACRGTLIRTRS